MSDLRKIKNMIDGDIEMLQEDIVKLLKHQQKALINQSDALMCECGAYDSTVIDSRDIKNTKQRRRECNICGKRWTTIEMRVEK